MSALVTLYMSQEDTTAASDVLINTVAWYKKNKPKAPELAVLTKANSAFQMQHGNPQVAAQTLEDQRKSVFLSNIIYLYMYIYSSFI